MDFLNKAYSQVTQLFASMTPAARITTGLLLAVLVVSLTFLFRHEGDTADDYLFGGEILSSSEINAIEAAFSSAKLSGWENEGNRIRVPRSKRSLFLEAVAEANAFPTTLTSIWDTFFQDTNPLKTRQVRELEARHNMERQLRFTIEQMSGIDVALVTIQEVDSDEFLRRGKRRALVSVKSIGNQNLDPNRVETVRNMAAYGGGVDQADVTVTDLNTGQSYPGTGENGALAENLYAKNQREFEQDLKSKVENRLATYPGLKVAVFVELDKEMVNRSISNKYDQQPTTVTTEDYSKEITSSTPNGGGRPGVASNTTISNQPAQVTDLASAESTTTERRENQQAVPSITQETTEQVPFAPTWMGVSIGVPRSYFVRLWREQNPTPEGEEPETPDQATLTAIEDDVVKDIEAAVTPLLNKVALGEDPYPRISVTPYTDPQLEVPDPPSVADKALTWLGDNWQTLGMFLLALTSVVVLRGMIRSGLSAAPASTPEGRTVGENLPNLATAMENEDEELADELVNSLRARFTTTGRSLRDELTEVVREDPDAAASVLQNWIGDAAG